MRPAIAASALCLGLLLLAALPAKPQTPASPTDLTPSATQVANDDAAKHAKRTACLKNAKAKKLVGADKTAFIKNCMDAPADALSASRVEKPQASKFSRLRRGNRQPHALRRGIAQLQYEGPAALQIKHDYFVRRVAAMLALKIICRHQGAIVHNVDPKRHIDRHPVTACPGNLEDCDPHVGIAARTFLA